jgi:hypothetical protein
LYRAYGSVARANNLIPLDTTDEFASTLERIDGQIGAVTGRGA